MDTTGPFGKFLHFVKSKRRIILFLLIGCIVVYTAGAWLSSEYTYFRSGMWEWEVKDFRENKRYFELVATDLYRYFEEEAESNDRLCRMIAENTSKKWDLRCFYDDTEEERTKTVAMTEAEEESMQKIMTALHHKYAGLFSIEIRQERVMFLTVYDYAVIWSRNGEKPAFLTSPDEEGKLFSCRLSFFSDRWYQCIRKLNA